MTFLNDIGKYFLMLGSMFTRPENVKMYAKETLRQVYQIGIGSFLIIAIVSTFVGAVTAVQFSYQLLDIGLIPMWWMGIIVRDSLILEMAPTITALLLAGKVGSNIASELGSMRVTEQIDALEVMGVNSANFLILPKIVAQLFFNPLLILMSMFLGLWGGAMAGDMLGLIAFQESISGYQLEFIVFENVIYGLIKSVVYAFIIGSVSAYSGYTVKGGAVEVGIASTNAVVRSCLAIILSNYVLTDLLLN